MVHQGGGNGREGIKKNRSNVLFVLRKAVVRSCTSRSPETKDEKQRNADKTKEVKKVMRQPKG